MVFDNLETIFIHIPKTGGTSIQFALSDVKLKFWKHSVNHLNTLEYLREQGAKFWKYHKFAVVRDPIEREYSLYNYFVKKSFKISFHQYLQKMLDDKDSFLKKKYARRKRYKNLFQDQIDFIAIDNNFYIDQIIRYEDLQNGYNQLCSKIGLPQKELKHFRKGNKSHIFSEEVKLIKKIRERDFEMLSY